MRKKTHIFIMYNPQNVLLNSFSRMSLQDVAVRMTCVDIRPAVWTCLLICEGNVELSGQGKCHCVNNMHSVKWYMNTMLCRTQLRCCAWVMCWGVMSEGDWTCLFPRPSHCPSFGWLPVHFCTLDNFGIKPHLRVKSRSGLPGVSLVVIYNSLCSQAFSGSSCWWLAIGSIDLGKILGPG